MAKYGKAYLWKALLNGLPVVALLLLATDAGLGLALAYTFALTVLAYLAGDLMILPPFGNTVATISDGLLAFVTVFSLRAYGVYVDPLHALLLAATVMLVEGLYYHNLLWTRVFEGRGGGR